MKALIVTSDITYVPQNQQQLFEQLFKGAEEHIVGLVVLKTVSFSLFKQIIGLYIWGCYNFASCLLKNIISLPRKKREHLWASRNLPTLRANNMNDPRVIKWVKDNKIDLIINVRTRCIYDDEILQASKLGCINVHHGILPKYRGTFCDLYAFSEGRSAGFTIHKMVKRLDAGEIYITKEVAVAGEKNYIKYLAKTGLIEGQVLANFINDIAKNGGLPKGTPNICDDIVFTKTPKNKQEINKLKAKGVVL